MGNLIMLLYEVVYKFFFEMVKVLIDVGVDVNA